MPVYAYALGRIPAEPDDPESGPGLVEIDPEHPQYDNWLASADPGEVLREQSQ